MSRTSEMDDDLLPEYDLTQLKLVSRGPGRRQPTLNVNIEPDVAELFPDSMAVNEGLRLLVRLLKQSQASLEAQSVDLPSK